MPRLSPLFVATLVAFASPAVTAGPLVAFTDTRPSSATAGFLSDTVVNWAASWTQTNATANVSLSALLRSNIGATTGNWYVTTVLGAAATAADVVYAGSYGLSGAALNAFDFNGAPRTQLGSGLDFAAGTYYLVLDGPAGAFANNAEWVGDYGTSVSLAAGFSLGDAYATLSPAGFAPAGDFQVSSDFGRFVFEMEEVGRVPLPGSLALAATALALLRLRSPRAHRAA